MAQVDHVIEASAEKIGGGRIGEAGHAKTPGKWLRPDNKLGVGT